MMYFLTFLTKIQRVKWQVFTSTLRLHCMDYKFNQKSTQSAALNKQELRGKLQFFRKTAHTEDYIFFIWYIRQPLFLPDPFPTTLATCCYRWLISPLAYPGHQCGNWDPQTRTPHCEKRVISWSQISASGETISFNIHMEKASQGLFVTDNIRVQTYCLIFFLRLIRQMHKTICVSVFMYMPLFVCWLTRGQEPRWQPDPQTAAAAGCSRSPPCADLSFPCEPAGDSWGSIWCDRTRTSGHSHHLYSPVTSTTRREVK